MKKVLFVGEHPLGYTGNSHMLNALLNQVDTDQFEPFVFANSSTLNSFLQYKYPIVEGGINPQDHLGVNRLLNLLHNNIFDFVVFVGIDIWAYAPIFGQLKELKAKQGWTWIAIFPYDSISIRKDWLKWISDVDIPCVYSEYGYDLLKDHIPNIQYFRPPLYDAEKFIPYTDQRRLEIKQGVFSPVRDKFIFGFFGHNQFRKDPQRLIKAFFLLKEKRPDIALYFHTDFNQGVFNLEQYIYDCGGKIGDIVIKKQGLQYSTDKLVETYNGIDCLVNVSLQEGLSWTIIEAMLCGTPVIMSNNTAHKDYLSKGVGLGVKCDELAYMPTTSEKGASFIETKACNVDDLVDKMEWMASCGEWREGLVRDGLKFAKQWADNSSNINNLFITPKIEVISPKKTEAVLFVQHSSAGDIFMTTRCFKGIKNRYKLPLHYMTQKKYWDILANNPYIDRIIDWDESNYSKYKFIVNPHGERIAPGHWGRNSNSLLSDFYWKILRVEPDDFFIEKKELEDSYKELLSHYSNYCIVHTTGGDPAFRTYKYMGDVCRELKGEFTTIQVGGKNDYPAGAEFDFRGGLSFRETAWIISQAKIAVTVDSFISHLCGALGVSQVCLFGSGNHNVVKPNQVKGELICMVPDYINDCPGLGPCSASVRDCPTPCTGIHDPQDIVNNLRRLL